jgi:hypothetical protein
MGMAARVLVDLEFGLHGMSVHKPWRFVLQSPKRQYVLLLMKYVLRRVLKKERQYVNCVHP